MLMFCHFEFEGPGFLFIGLISFGAEPLDVHAGGELSSAINTSKAQLFRFATPAPQH